MTNTEFNFFKPITTDRLKTYSHEPPRNGAGYIIINTPSNNGDLYDSIKHLIDIPKLEGFEKVLGRKFTCKECQYYMGNLNECKWGFMGYWKNACTELSLCDDTKAEIKLKDYEIDTTKIDTHPRFEIFGTILWDKYGNKVKKGWEIIL